jgi:hypothetical protein
MYLTVSDLRLALSCPTKLFYQKAGYKATREMDSYSYCFGDGSLVLRKIAQLLYPQGVAIADGDRALQHLLADQSAVVFDCCLRSQHKQAVIDILQRQQDTLHIIAPKARTFDSKHHRVFRNKRTGEVNGDWRHTIEEVAWQKWILSELLASCSQLKIACALLLPDRHKPCGIDNLLQQFTLRSPAHEGEQPTVDFVGDRLQLQQNHFLTLVDISPEVEEVLPALQAKAQPYLEWVSQELRRPRSPLGKHCRDCEFKEGFKECWGALAEVQPHIFDLYQMGRLTSNGEPLVNQLIHQGKVSLYDVPLEELTDSNYSDRQLVQITYTQKNQEWRSPQLAQVLEKFSYPLHFIDFETARLLIPPTAQLRPNEQIAFQWSCHTLYAPDTPPSHSDWLDTTNPFPNLEFAQSLMTHLNSPQHQGGTIFTWGTHEASVLRDIQRQMTVYGYHRPSLKHWLEQISRKSVLVDMDALTRQHYFHPLMKHRTSLKWVVSAIWSTNPYLHHIPYLRELYCEEQGQILSPYATLPKLQLDPHQPAIAITDGTGAMLNYLEIMYGSTSSHPKSRQVRRQLLRQYCRMDTLAMVIVWLHWCKLGEISGNRLECG